MYKDYNFFRKDVNQCKTIAIFEERTLINDTLIKTDVIKFHVIRYILNFITLSTDHIKISAKNHSRMQQKIHHYRILQNIPRNSYIKGTDIRGN